MFKEADWRYFRLQLRDERLKFLRIIQFGDALTEESMLRRIVTRRLHISWSGRELGVRPIDRSFSRADLLRRFFVCFHKICPMAAFCLPEWKSEHRRVGMAT